MVLLGLAGQAAAVRRRAASEPAPKTTAKTAA